MKTRKMRLPALMALAVVATGCTTQVKAPDTAPIYAEINRVERTTADRINALEARVRDLEGEGR